MKTGDKVKILIEGTISEESNAHGLCFKVQFLRKDFSHVRSVWVNEDEVQLSEYEINSTSSLLEQKYVGQNWNDVQESLNSKSYRLTKKDDTSYIVTTDFKPDRLNFQVVNNIVTDVSKG